MTSLILEIVLTGLLVLGVFFFVLHKLNHRASEGVFDCTDTEPVSCSAFATKDDDRPALEKVETGDDGGLPTYQT